MACHHAIIEAESVQLNQYWEVVSVGGRDVVQMAIDPPNNVHQFGGGNSINLGDVAQVDASRLYYTINVPEDCNYQVSLYTRAWDQIDGQADLGNDLWIRIATGSDIVGETSRGSDYHKMFSNNNSNFQWAQTVVGDRYCKFLPAGTHVIEIAARSYHFQLDRLVIWCKEGCTFGNDWTTKSAGDYNGSAFATLSCTQSSWDQPVLKEKTLPASSLWQPGDVLALHYDVAPDLDDLHAIAAGCNVTECFNINPCVVIGAVGINRQNDYTTTRENKAIAVANAAYGAGNYLNTGGSIGSAQWDAAVASQAAKWLAAINAGNDVWLAEGGPSDFTHDVLLELLNLGVALTTINNRIHVVQHSTWNENETANADLSYVQNNTDYVKIDDGNNVNNTADLNDNSQLNQFRPWAENSACGAAWISALNGLDPNNKLDFSDVVELLHIMGIPKSVINTPMDFCNYFD